MQLLEDEQGGVTSLYDDKQDENVQETDNSETEEITTPAACTDI